MKTGRPECYIPSAETVSRDVKNVFVSVCKRISDMLQVSFSDIITKSFGLLTCITEIRREVELCHGCVDVAQPQGLHGDYSAFRTRGTRHGDAS